MQSSFNSRLLSIANWNVNGLSENFFLGNKLSNSDFIRSFNHCDIIILTETWQTDEISLPGFEIFTVPSLKHHKKKTEGLPGGIALGFTTGIKQGIKLISHRNNLLWT